MILRRMPHSIIAKSRAIAQYSSSPPSSPPPSLLQPGKDLLLRDYIHECLYASEGGYFNQKDLIKTPGLAERIAFANLRDQQHYFDLLDDLYCSGVRSWTTPSNLFSPIYGRSVAKYIIATRDSAYPLRIYEVGGGNGTIASDILDYIREEAPEVYRSTEYHMIDVSQELHNRQQARFHRSGPLASLESVAGVSEHHSDRVVCHRRDINEWPEQEVYPCFVLAFEVLDNMPHDRIVVNPQEKTIHETHVVCKNGNSAEFEEILKPLSDPVIERYWNMLVEAESQGKLPGSSGLSHKPSFLSNLFSSKSARDRNTFFLPTASLRLLDTLASRFPKHHLIAADFDELPDTVIKGDTAPVVQSKRLKSTLPVPSLARPGARKGILIQTETEKKFVRYESVNHNSYFEQPGNCDIFFPTNFTRLQAIYSAVNNGNYQFSNTMKSDALMKKFAEVDRTRALSGFNPLLADFKNTAFFMGKRQ